STWAARSTTKLTEELLHQLVWHAAAAAESSEPAKIRPPRSVGRAETIIIRTLGGVVENLIGVLHLLALGLGFLVAGIAVRVEFPRQLMIGLGNVFRCRVSGDAENFIRIARHGLMDSEVTNQPCFIVR